MPWSWIRVSRTSCDDGPELTSGDRAVADFAADVRRTAQAAGAGDVDVKFEPDGRSSRVLFSWDDPQVKYAVVYGLRGQEVVDLLSADEMEAVAARRSGG